MRRGRGGQRGWVKPMGEGGFVPRGRGFMRGRGQQGGGRGVFRNMSSKKEGRKEVYYLMTHSTHFIYGYVVTDHSDSERGLIVHSHASHWNMFMALYTVNNIF